MQQTSRIYVRFKEENDWQTFIEEMKFGNPQDQKAHALAEYENNFEKSFELFENGIILDRNKRDCQIGGFFDDNIAKQLCEVIARFIGNKGIILADTYNYSYYPESSQEYYFFGEELHDYYRYKSAGKHFDIDISDINKWLGTTRKKELSDNEKMTIKEIMKNR